MIKPEDMPKYVEWRNSFVPPADAIDYVSQRLSVTDVVLLLNLMLPPLTEVRGCVLLKDRYSADAFNQWHDRLGEDSSAIESVINQMNFWDVFDPEDAAEDRALNDVARLFADVWKDHAERTFPGRTFDTATTDTYGPGVTLFQRRDAITTADATRKFFARDDRPPF